MRLTYTGHPHGEAQLSLKSALGWTEPRLPCQHTPGDVRALDEHPTEVQHVADSGIAHREYGGISQE
jgi:hypothetical protein